MGAAVCTASWLLVAPLRLESAWKDVSGERDMLGAQALATPIIVRRATRNRMVKIKSARPKSS
jgi:hypothetical protein